jgi:hypothetical protein
MLINFVWLCMMPLGAVAIGFVVAPLIHTPHAFCVEQPHDMLPNVTTVPAAAQR